MEVIRRVPQVFTVTTYDNGGAVAETGLTLYQAALVAGQRFDIPDGAAWQRLSGRLVALPPGCMFAGPGRDGGWVKVERTK